MGGVLRLVRARSAGDADRRRSQEPVQQVRVAGDGGEWVVVEEAVEREAVVFEESVFLFEEGIVFIEEGFVFEESIVIEEGIFFFEESLIFEEGIVIFKESFFFEEAIVLIEERIFVFEESVFLEESVLFEEIREARQTLNSPREPRVQSLPSRRVPA